MVVEDDPAADLHDWYGRYLYFAPEEVEPLGRATQSKEFVMEFVSVIAAAMAARRARGVVIGVRSIPDVQRYLKMRRM